MKIEKIEAYKYAGKKFFKLKDAQTYQKIYDDFKKLENVKEINEAMGKYMDLILKHFENFRGHFNNGDSYRNCSKHNYYNGLYDWVSERDFREKYPIVLEMYKKLMHAYTEKYGYTYAEEYQHWVDAGMEDRRGICGF